MTTFQKNDKVVARTSTQGLRQGETYRIENVIQNPTPFGNFVSYVVASLRPEEPGFEWTVVNGHLILDKAIESGEAWMARFLELVSAHTVFSGLTAEGLEIIREALKARHDAKFPGQPYGSILRSKRLETLHGHALNLR